MSKPLKYVIIGFVLFFSFSIGAYFISNLIRHNNSAQNIVAQVDDGVILDIDKVVKNGKWYDITEEDKITLAMSAETNIVSVVKDYLKDNKIAIFFVYGGPFDYSLEGNYIICTGFNESGKAKILYPNDNFSKEWRYSFEGLIEFSNKVMLFEM